MGRLRAGLAGAWTDRCRARRARTRGSQRPVCSFDDHRKRRADPDGDRSRTSRRQLDLRRLPLRGLLRARCLQSQAPLLNEQAAILYVEQPGLLGDGTGLRRGNAQLQPQGGGARGHRLAVAAGATALWLQLGIASPEARAIAEEAGLLYVEDRCLFIEQRRLGLKAPRPQ